MWNTKQQRRSGGIASVVIILVAVGLAAMLVLNRQHVLDQWNVWQYKPSAAVTNLVERAGLNDGGEFYFYASQPAVQDAGEFNKNCSRKEASSAILGCYNGQNVFIYNVTNSQLDGIREVTAAHEMLHVVYARLGSSERTQLHQLLTSEYEKLKNDKDFAERMAFYERTEPGERDNELHSIIGTEVPAVSVELEMYYKKYFTDRQKVVALHQNYATVFNDLQKRGQEISARLTSLAAIIENDSQRYNAEVARLKQDITSFNAKAERGEFSSDAEFQAARATLAARGGQLETMRKAINEAIQQYNSLRDDLTTIASESEALNRSIDSNLAPAPSL